MEARHYVSLSLGLAAALLLAPLAGSTKAGAVALFEAPQNQHLEIDNGSSDSVTVRVLHSDGSLQKQETVKAGGTHRFTFEWCENCCGNDKQRRFEVKTGSALRATGQLEMSTASVFDGAFGTATCHETNAMTVKDENTSDSWTFSTKYENGHRTAVLGVTNASS
jgi:hypothetical protein